MLGAFLNFSLPEVLFKIRRKKGGLEEERGGGRGEVEKGKGGDRERREVGGQRKGKVNVPPKGSVFKAWSLTGGTTKK